MFLDPKNTVIDDWYWHEKWYHKYLELLQEFLIIGALDK